MAKVILVLDTKPVPVVGYQRSKQHNDFKGSATGGYCASRKLNYFGYKLVMITTLLGIPLVYDLVSAYTDERAAAETVLVDSRAILFWLTRGSLALTGKPMSVESRAIAFLRRCEPITIPRTHLHSTASWESFVSELKGYSTKFRILANT